MIILVPPLIPSASASKSASHPKTSSSLDSMIRRIRCRLIQYLLWRASKLHPLALESQVSDPRNILLAISMVIGKEQCEVLNFAELRTLDRNILDVRGPGEMKLLYRCQVGGGREIEVIAVDEYLQGPGRGIGVGGTD